MADFADTKDTKNAFVVQINNDQYNFSAATQPEKIEWMRDFNEAISNVRRKKVFGIPLKELIDNEIELNCGKLVDIPWIVRNSIEFLLANSTEAEGLFRLSGSAKEIERLSGLIDDGERFEWKLGEHDDHVVAGVFKLWIRELPEPIMTNEFYAEWIAAMKLGSASEINAACAAIISKIDDIHRFLLQYLMQCLHAVASKSDINKMTSGNLSIVFGPNILGKRSKSIVDPDYSAVYDVCSHLIDHYETLFSGVEEERIARESMREELEQKTKELKDAEIAELENIELWRPEDLREEAIKKAPLPDGDVVMEGFLDKKGANRRNWKTRWFVLHYKSLAYLKNSKDKTPQGVIVLDNCCVDTSSAKGRPFCFTIITENRSYYISVSYTHLTLPTNREV
eukprot:TRINITY_DN8047_c0_g1_i2.p1 TRINITY_DN8047_c0_g1~~TRINITY_DN8047_c0_g1_i2.p1  ORF type:complete len:406 (-),score=59.27 TRINITY_DN8047_c0_g1_i2:8-1195(-)